MKSSATLSADRRFRYSLERALPPVEVSSGVFKNPSTVMFIGINPSTADEYENDPTIRKEIGFARRWSFSDLVKVNLFPYRSTKPIGLLGHELEEMESNEVHILSAAARSNLVIASWGGPYAPKRLQQAIQLRAQLVEAMLAKHLPKVQLHALGVTKDGHPRHVLYMPYDSEPRPWSSWKAIL